MRCLEIKGRLVAWQDGELSPGEHTRVGEHLDTCRPCAALAAGLARATPEPCLRPQPAYEASLWERLDAAVDRELDAPAPPLHAPPPLATLRDWLGSDTRVPVPALLAYAALLALSLSWGAANWWTAQALRGGPPPIAAAPNAQAPAIDELPIEQFRPASYVPDDGSAP